MKNNKLKKINIKEKTIPIFISIIVFILVILLFFKVFFNSKYEYIEFKPKLSIIDNINNNDIIDYNSDFAKIILNKSKLDKIKEKIITNNLDIYLEENFYKSKDNFLNWKRNLPFVYDDLYNVKELQFTIFKYSSILTKDSLLYKKLATIASLYTNQNSKIFENYGNFLDIQFFYDINETKPQDFANYKNILISAKYHFDFFINTPLANIENYSPYHLYWQRKLIREPYEFSNSELKECKKNNYYQINLEEFVKIENNPYILSLASAINNARYFICRNFTELYKVEYMLKTRYLTNNEKIRLLEIRNKLASY